MKQYNTKLKKYDNPATWERNGWGVFIVANIWMSLGLVMQSTPAMMVGLFCFFAYAWILYIEVKFVEKIAEQQDEVEIIENKRTSN